MIAHQARRARLLENILPGLIVLPNAPTVKRNRDNTYPYRFDSDFYYLTGFTEPDAVWVQVVGEKPLSLLFCLPKDEQSERWQGYRYGPTQAAQQFGFDEAYPLAQLNEKLADLIVQQPRLYFPVGAYAHWDRLLLGLVDELRRQSRDDSHLPNEFIDIRCPIHELRLIKDSSELQLMRQAAQISAQAHSLAMQACRPGQYEYEIEALLCYHFSRHGSRSPAYPPIVASGANSCVLHYVTNNRQMQAGELLLIDAGCEWHGYAADISRTLPVDGQFNGAQRSIYALVLAAQQAALSQISAGQSRMAYHDAAVRVLTQGLVDLNILKGSVDGLIESHAYKQFYMHGTGHWLGLDVHDVGAYQQQGQARQLSAGMVLTVEPGLYFTPAPNVPEAYANIGIRIEDDIVVTDNGYENLTAAAPKAMADIEALMAG